MLTIVIILIVMAVVVIAIALVRSAYKESRAHSATLPDRDVRGGWPAPTEVGQRVMWCPLLARKVILADTMLDDGDLGTVIALEGRRPVIAFDGRDGEPVVDKWGGARVLPPEHEPRPARPVPPKRRPKKKGKRRR